MEPVVINESNLSPEEISFLQAQGFAVDAPQGSDEWLEERLGLATASRFLDIVKRDRSNKPCAGYYSYKYELVVERLTGKMRRFSSKPMQWGTQHEEEAAEIYTMLTDYDVAETGFMKHATIDAGASPDRLVNDNGLLEIKCPNTMTHINYLMGGKVPDIYYPQIQGQLWITEREWCDFMSYDPEMPENAQVFITRVERDKEYIKDMYVKIISFLDDVKGAEEWLTNYDQLNPLQ